VAICNGRSGFDLYSVSTSGQHQQFSIPPDSVAVDLPVAFAHDGLAVVGGNTKGQIRVWDTETGQRLQTLNHIPGELLKHISV
jgi:COMPASS component SWD3